MLSDGGGIRSLLILQERRTDTPCTTLSPSLCICDAAYLLCVERAQPCRTVYIVALGWHKHHVVRVRKSRFTSLRSCFIYVKYENLPTVHLPSRRSTGVNGIHQVMSSITRRKCQSTGLHVLASEMSFGNWISQLEVPPEQNRAAC